MAATSTSSAAPDRLTALRGPVAPRHHDARTLAALTANPGCARRAVLDAAGVDKRALAERIGFGPRFGQSPFAISRGNSFERLVKADGGTALLGLLRSELGLRPVVPAESADHQRPAEEALLDLGRGELRERHQRTRDLVAAASGDPAAVPAQADHPLLRLDVGGRAAHVEPDLAALLVPDRDPASGPRWHLVEVKSFAVVDGRADPLKVAEAATQAAVYVLAFRRLLAELALPEDLVATDVVLVCPKDFSNTPTLALIDVRRQVAAVRRQLERLPRVGALVDGLDPDVSFDLSADADGQPVRSPDELGRSVAQLDARYAPECISRCDMAFYCRQEARAAGATQLLGPAVRDALGGVATMREVLALGEQGRGGEDDGADRPGYGDDLAEAALLLRAARRARREALAQAGGDATGAAA
jgi:hypothetical protein